MSAAMRAPGNPQPLAEFIHIGKTYANGTVALQDVSFRIYPGQIHAVCGENGAGKSTLMKILFGMEQPSRGHLRLHGKEVRPDSPRAAAALGIGMVHQHFSLIPQLTVAENLMLGHEPMGRGLMQGWLLDRKASVRRVSELAERYRLVVDPGALVSTLSVAMQQKVEILKALSQPVRLLILDEPTAVLTPQETAELFERLRELNRGGMAILFISHKLQEVRALADRIIVLRGGTVTSDTPLADVSDQDITRHAMGQAVVRTRRDQSGASGDPGPPCLSLRQANRDKGPAALRISALSLDLHAGGITGVAGVDGSGQAGLAGALVGALPLQSGQLILDTHDITKCGVGERRRLGFAHLPADRLRDGSAPALSLADNAIARLARRWWMRRAAGESATREMIATYGVRCQSPSQPLSSLSGGNAQKLIAAREFGGRPRILVAEEPTRGIDMLAASFIHQRLLALANDGCAVLLLSSDLDELLSLCGHIVVMHGGRIVARYDNHDGLTPQVLGAAMLGLEHAA